jgi:ubiquinone/menaquinone biosynthesis C-methylase UbiE
VDHEQFRIDSRERWEAAASGWGARRDLFQRATEQVSRWMVDAIEPQPGHVVLDLAAGPGDTGFLAAERIKPGGRLISTDGAEAMVEVARARAKELGIDNAEHRAMEAEWIDLPTASVDGVLCRWGYMLLADPEAALRETRRVLRPGGRVALAAWDAPGRNPWASAFQDELAERSINPPQEGCGPTMFSLAEAGRVDQLLADAGFTEWRVEAIDFAFEAPSFDDWWEVQYDLSPSLPGALGSISPEQRDAVHAAIEARMAHYREPDGSLRMPARTLVAVAEA